MAFHTLLTVLLMFFLSSINDLNGYFWYVEASMLPLIRSIWYVPNKFQRLVFRLRSNKEYTPLLFFTVPKGVMIECDAMEQIISDLECELNVRVERMDIMRQPINEVLLDMIASSTSTSSYAPIKSQPPLLYHRESCQIYTIPTVSSKNKNDSPTTKSTTTSSSARSLYIDKDKIRALMKGRYLKISSSFMNYNNNNYQNVIRSSSNSHDNARDRRLIEPDDMENDEIQQQQQQQLQMNEMLEDMALTPQQRKGKQLIQQRTEALRQTNERKKQQQEQKKKKETGKTEKE
jgi:hypothetical protein